MLFNSCVFIFAFLPVVLGVYVFLRRLPNINWAVGWLALASLFYYGWWKPLQTRGMPGFTQLPKHVVVPELNTIDRMQRIHEALERNHFGETQIEKIMGGNWTRVLKSVLG